MNQTQARALLASALREAMEKFDASQAAAARWMGVTERCVGAWVRQENAMSVETVLESPKLGKAFVEALSARMEAAE